MLVVVISTGHGSLSTPTAARISSVSSNSSAMTPPRSILRAVTLGVPRRCAESGSACQDRRVNEVIEPSVVDLDRLTAWMDQRGLEAGPLIGPELITGGTQN